MKVLVAYSSRHGATKGIAEHIAKTLADEQLDVALRSVADVEGMPLLRDVDSVEGEALPELHL